jgi:hypothetical protein
MDCSQAQKVHSDICHRAKRMVVAESVVAHRSKMTWCALELVSWPWLSTIRAYGLEIQAIRMGEGSRRDNASHPNFAYPAQAPGERT